MIPGGSHPWFDRYNRQPHVIYLPLSVARLDENLRVMQPYGLTFTADDSSAIFPADVRGTSSAGCIFPLSDSADRLLGFILSIISQNRIPKDRPVRCFW